MHVEYVNAAYPSQMCHACNRLGRQDYNGIRVST
ncbi:hypothetical protein [Halorussus salinus]